MSILKLTIKNCKSIEFAEIILKENLNCLIGTNNVGKSNIMKALNFYYLNLTGEHFDDLMFSKSNPYNDELEISVEYDFSDLIKKKDINTFNDFIEPTNEIFDKIKYYSKKYCTNNKVILSLIYNKNKTITWNIKDYEFRAFLSVRFPVFYLESRNIDLYNWDSIWEVIGSIAPFRQKVNISKGIKGIFEENSQIHDNYQEVIDIILNVFEDSEIKIQKTNIFEKISQIIQLQVGGKDFNYHSHSLQTGSYGMNSYTYMNLYINLILGLYEYKYLATPLIMLDEPELHLHVKKIEEFVKSIKENKNYSSTKWIFATHSPSFTKQLILENSNYSFFYITNNRFFNRTYVNKINGFKQKKYKYLTDNEAALFFSDACLFVEGDTELELFKNEKIQVLFPKLSEIDIFSFEGKNDKLQLVNPNDRKSKIKFLVLIDMDKLVSYVPPKKKFSVTGSAYLNVIKNKNLVKREKYNYNEKFNNTFIKRNEILTTIKTINFEIDSSGMCLKKNNERLELINLMQEYYLNYNFLPLETTIEGCIINTANYELFHKWLNQFEWDNSLFNSIYNSFTNEYQKTSFLRIIFFGKTDWLSGEKEENNNSGKEYNIFIETFPKIKLIRTELKKSSLKLDGKTSGWVTLFINWIFQKEILLESNNDIFINRNNFLSKFPELGKVIVYLEEMV